MKYTFFVLQLNRLLVYRISCLKHRRNLLKMAKKKHHQLQLIKCQVKAIYSNKSTIKLNLIAHSKLSSVIIIYTVHRTQIM